MARLTLPEFGAIESEFSPVPADTYACRIHAVEQRETKKKDGYYLHIEARIAEGDCSGRSLFFNCSLKESALWNLKKFVECAGVPYDDDGLDTDDILGAEVGLVVSLGEYDGKPSNDVDDYVSLNS